MTVVAWDGKTLAADKRGTSGGFRKTITKLFRIDNHLVGINGSAAHAGAFLAWFVAGRDPATFPTIAEKEEFLFALAISPAKNILSFEGTAYPVLIESPFHACGSGRDFAIAAMHLGCDAVKAVEVASAYQVDCGDGVDALTFDEPS